MSPYDCMNASNTYIEWRETPAELRQRLAWEAFVERERELDDRHARTCVTCFEHGGGFCSYTDTETGEPMFYNDVDETAWLCGIEPMSETAWRA